MNKHLPECPAGYVADLCTTDIDPVLQEPTCNHCVGQGCICICNRLRACEQRVRMEDDDYAYVAAQAEADGRRRGWVEALDAAREALLSAWFTANRDEMTWPDALAAIDALWEVSYGRSRSE